jgi:O-antigen ligase
LPLLAYFSGTLFISVFGTLYFSIYNSSGDQINVMKKEGLIFFIDKCTFFLLIIAFVFIPSHIRMQKFMFFTLVPSLRTDVYTGIHYDFHSLSKIKLLILITFLLLFLFVLKLFFKQFVLCFYIEHVLVLFILAMYLLSSALSPYWYNTMFGFVDFHQGFINTVCFVTIFFIASLNRYYSKDHTCLLLGLSVLVAINTILLVLPKLGIEIVQSNLFQALTIPSNLSNDIQIEQLKSLFGNTNYSSGFMASAFITYLYAFIFDNKKPIKVFAFIFMGISLLGVYLSSALSGYFTIALTLPLVIGLLFVNRKKLGLEKQVERYIIYFLFVMLIFSFIVILNDSLRTKLLDIIDVEKAVDMSKRPIARYYHENFGFPMPYRSLGANRLGIWEETVKLILEKPIIGHGADTLYYYFPNNSFAAYEKITNVYNCDIITKPHNYFLSIAFDAGIPALISFLLLVFVMLKRSLKALFSLISEANIMVGSLSVFSIALLCQGIPNDFTVGTATLLWISLGLWAGLINCRNNTKGDCC